MRMWRPGLWVSVIILCLTQIQCTWTPEVETPIFSSEQGTVALRTFHDFRKPPSQPTNLPHSLLHELFNGLSYTQETGILQELLNSSSSKPLPVFSKAQIDFLVPYVSLAVAQATEEELIDFSCLPVEASESWIKGSLGVFDSHILLLTIEISKNPLGPHSARSPKQTAFRDMATLGFLKPEATLPPPRIQLMIDLPVHPHWIAIDFSTLLPSQEQNEATPHTTNQPVKNPESLNDEDPRIQKLEKKMDRLLEKIEEQNKEIQRLQEATP